MGIPVHKSWLPLSVSGPWVNLLERDDPRNSTGGVTEGFELKTLAGTNCPKRHSEISVFHFVRFFLPNPPGPPPPPCSTCVSAL